MGRAAPRARLQIGKCRSSLMPFAKTPEFYTALGFFYAIWSQIELTIDYATWKAFGGTETPEQAHARSAGAKFSDKCKEFRTLLEARNVCGDERMKELLAQIENSMRNVFAHSFMATDEDCTAARF